MYCWRLILVMLCALWAYGQSNRPLIVIIGPPGAGKTTQTEYLKKTFKMPALSADDVVKLHAEALAKARSAALNNIEPKLDPMMSRLVANELRAMDLSKGLILDGYPASKDQGDHLGKLIDELGLPAPIVLHLKVPDDVVRKRMKGEPEEKLEDSLKSYHREMDFINAYYPEGAIYSVDGTRKPKAVSKSIRKVVNGRLKQKAK